MKIADTPTASEAMEIPSLPTPLPAMPVRRGADDAALREAAEAFEAVFLEEMLKHTGVNAMPDGFGGGVGEEGFASFLTAEQARLIAARGGLGLADHIFEALKAREGGQ